MDFQEATDLLMELGVRLEDVAAALDVVHGTVRQARLDPAASSYRNPPAGWQAKLAQLARDRSAALAKLAERLERETG